MKHFRLLGFLVIAGLFLMPLALALLASVAGVGLDVRVMAILVLSGLILAVMILGLMRAASAKNGGEEE